MTPCPRCGAPDAGGEYCLTCGSRVRAPTRSDRFRERLAGNHLWTALAVIVLAALGALVAIAASRGGSTEQTVVATSLPDRTTLRTAPVLGTLTEPPTTAPATTAAPRPPAGPTSTTLTEWTLADGYTLVLASVPQGGFGGNLRYFLVTASWFTWPSLLRSAYCSHLRRYRPGRRSSSRRYAAAACRPFGMAESPGFG